MTTRYPKYFFVDNIYVMDLFDNVLSRMEINCRDECPRLRSVDGWEVEGRVVE